MCIFTSETTSQDDGEDGEESCDSGDSFDGFGISWDGDVAVC